MDDLVAVIEREIERLHRRYASFLREVPDSHELTARFSISHGVLRWHVTLEEVLEPDVDLEITGDAILVRARPASRTESLLVAILAVPSGFDLTRLRVRFEAGYLEVRVERPGANP